MQSNKINTFLEEHAETFDQENAAQSTPSSSSANLINYIDTANLVGIRLRAAELYNTLMRALLGRYISRRNQKSALNHLTGKYIDFCLSNSIDIQNFDLNTTNRIFLDVTYTILQTNITGIPRVVTEIAKIGARSAIIPVFIFENNIYAYNPLISKIELIVFNSNDCYFQADAGWNYLSELSSILDSINQISAKSVVLLYDLIPCNYPILSNSSHVKVFNEWIDIQLTKSKYMICISKSVADEIINNIRLRNDNNIYLSSIGWSHLGSNFLLENDQSHKRNFQNEYLFNFAITLPKYFLSVGTLEPRKGNLITVQAMELLWARGLDAGLVIVGKYGWSQTSLKHHILNHREFGKRLFWFNSASDYELEFLYKNALALVSSTLCEGFGLPIIEAAYYGLSSIVSDIPVFREIGGNSTKYFEVTNSNQLATLLEDCLQNPKVAPEIDILSWEEAVDNMLCMIKSEDYQYKSW